MQGALSSPGPPDCPGRGRGSEDTVCSRLWRPHASLAPARLPLYLASLLISLVFLLVNLTCAVLARTGSGERKAVVSVRVAVNDTLFVLCAVSLSVCLYRISKMSLANIYLESKVRWAGGQ